MSQSLSVVPVVLNSKSVCELEVIHQRQHDIFEQLRSFVRDNAPQLDLYNGEKKLFPTLLALGKAFMAEFIALRGTGKVIGIIDADGEMLPYHDTKDTTYLSIFGEIEIKRAYYWRDGHKGICPLDVSLNLPARRYSYLLDDWVQRTLTEEPYDKAIERFSNILGIPVSKLGQQHVAQEAGPKFNEFYQQKQAIDQTTEGTHLGLQVDEKGVRMVASEKPEATEAKNKPVRRGKGEKSGLRKMATVTVEFTFNPETRTPEEMLKILMKEADQKPVATTKPKPRTALNATVAATMAGKQAALDEAIKRVRKRDPSGEKKLVILMDGDPALEDQMLARLQAAGMADRVDAVILDIMHAMEYLWDAGTALHGERAAERVPWVREHALKILEGNVGYVIGGLRIILSKRKLKPSQRTAVQKAITYFYNHKHMMRYDRYLAAGYPIATGLVEGACGSLVKDRADRSGSRWSSVGVQAILNERAIMKNGDWDAFWEYHMKTENKRLYGNFKIIAASNTINSD